MILLRIRMKSRNKSKCILPLNMLYTTLGIGITFLRLLSSSSKIPKDLIMSLPISVFLD